MSATEDRLRPPEPRGRRSRRRRDRSRRRTSSMPGTRGCLRDPAPASTGGSPDRPRCRRPQTRSAPATALDTRVERGRVRCECREERVRFDELARALWWTQQHRVAPQSIRDIGDVCVANRRCVQLRVAAARARSFFVRSACRRSAGRRGIGGAGRSGRRARARRLARRSQQTSNRTCTVGRGAGVATRLEAIQATRSAQCQRDRGEWAPPTAGER